MSNPGEPSIFDIYVRPFVVGAPASGGKWQIGSGYGSVWSREARQLFYQTRDGIMVVDYTAEGDSFHPGKPRHWLEKPVSFFDGRIFDVTPDGTRIVLLQFSEPADEPKGHLHMTLQVNWFDEVTRRLNAAGR
jgi:hypothetical protein